MGNFVPTPAIIEGALLEAHERLDRWTGEQREMILNTLRDVKRVENREWRMEGEPKFASGKWIDEVYEPARLAELERLHSSLNAYLGTEISRVDMGYVELAISVIAKYESVAEGAS